MERFSGIWVPMVTPFRQGGLDLDAAQRLACRLRDDGVAGLVLCGTTGEAATLAANEQRRLLHAVRGAVGEGLPIVFGLSGNDTAAVCTAARAFDSEALAGLLISAPYYTRPSQAGLRLHFEAVAASTRHDILLYNIPYRTGVNMEPATCRALATHPRIVAIKESSGGQLDQLGELIDTTPLRVLCGEDSLFYVAACLGAHGAIAASAHIRPDLWVRLFEYVQAGELAAARQVRAALLPLVRLLFAEPNPGPLKAALAMLGEMADEVRLPLLPAGEDLRDRLAEAMAALPSRSPS